MTLNEYRELSSQISEYLGLSSVPLAISFSDTVPEGVERFDEPMPEPTADGRTGRVAAGCVFWMKAQDKTFATVAEDHGNCSVGSMTHGFKTMEEVAGNSDIAALLDSKWVTMEAVPGIPVISKRPECVTYGPLAKTPVEPDVVFLRLNAKQAMILSDAWPEIQYEGKPQCHVIPIAKEQDKVAISVGCMLSRVRTGMSNNELTCAIPAARLPELIERLGSTLMADKAVAAYASEDKKRFENSAN